MELNHDWRGFQTVFHARRRLGQRAAFGLSEMSAAETMVYLVVDGTRVISACGQEGEDTTHWIGQSVTEVAAQIPHRELVLFTRKEVDQWMNGCLQLPHFYEQMEFLRTQSVPEAISAQGKVKRVRPVARRHFLLDALQGWWTRILPNAFGILIRLENPAGLSGKMPSAPPTFQEIFLLIRRGKLELFHTPDLSVLGVERSRKPEAVVKYLAERHGVPVQGLFVPAEEWAEWSEPAHESEAWRKLAFALKADRARLVPFRWQVAALGATKAFLGL